MSSITRTLSDANNIATEYTDNFDGKYNSSPIQHSASLSEIIGILSGSRRRLIIFLAIVIVMVGYTLHSLKPDYVCSKRISPTDPKRVDTGEWLKYTLLISLLLYIPAIVLIYRSRLREYLFNGCGMCKG
jgi:hypothetical protein